MESSMETKTNFRVLPDNSANCIRYDINGICETADSIYWTLVPKEVFAIWNTPYFVSFCMTVDNK